MIYEFCKENFGTDYMLIYAIADELNERCFTEDNSPALEYRQELCRAIYALRNTEPVKNIDRDLRGDCYDSSDIDWIRDLLFDQGFNIPPIWQD